MAAADAQQTPPASVEATTVQTLGPEAIAYDTSGNLYIALRNDHVVRKVDALGIITTVAGTGVQGFAGDGGSATSAMLDSPSGVAVDGSGNIYIADSRNHRIRVVKNGVITTVAGTGAAGFGGDGQVATSALLDLPTALSLDAAGALLIADTNNNRIRKLANGIVTTVAGSGEQGFAGEGRAAVNALLDTPGGVAADFSSSGSFVIADTGNGVLRRVDANGIITSAASGSTTLLKPRGVSIDSAGSVYVADSGNNAIRKLSGTSLSTVAGTGEQGFAGDLSSGASAVLDTPRATATSGANLLGIADTHNQRVRALSASTINTVAGVPPTLTEGIVLSGPTSGTYNAGNGRLIATFSSPVAAASGSLQLSINGQAGAMATIAGNTASFDLSTLSGGIQTLAVSFPGDTRNAPVVSGVYLVNILAATQTVSFPSLQSPVVFAPGATVQLTATSSSGLPVTYAVSGPASVSGSTLTYTGPGNVTVTASQSGTANYAAASANQVVRISPSPIVANSVTPATVSLSSTATTLTIVGSGFTSTSVIGVNGTLLASSVQSANRIMASLPAVSSTAALMATVYDPATGFESSALPIQVSAQTAAATLSAPSISASRQQPAVQIALQNSYPVAINGVLTLTFTPLNDASQDDPTVVFSNGLRVYQFNIAANATTTPSIPFSTGTLAGTVTLNLSLTAGGVDVTPASARVVTVTVPAEVPAASGVTFTQNGPTVTVTYVGYSNTRNVSQAVFNFKPASGTSLAQSAFTVPVTDIFNQWFTSAQLQQMGGSIFTYTQTFNLSDAGAKIQGVTVTLTNTAGDSIPASTP